MAENNNVDNIGNVDNVWPVNISKLNIPVGNTNNANAANLSWLNNPAPKPTIPKVVTNPLRVLGPPGVVLNPLYVPKPVIPKVVYNPMRAGTKKQRKQRKSTRRNRKQN